MEPTQSEITAAIPTPTGIESAAFRAGWRAAMVRTQHRLGDVVSGAPFARTKIARGGVTFVVSTINRQSSSLLAAGAEYAETIAWEWSDADQSPASIAGMLDAPAGSITGHCEMLRRIHETGSAADPECDDA